MKLNLIQKSTAKQETITLYYPQSWFDKFLDRLPIAHSTIPGKVTYTDCIIESDTELQICQQFTHIFDNETYHGITPLKKVTGSISQYICAVDYVSKNV